MIFVNYEQLPKGYTVLRGSSVTHIFVYSKPFDRDADALHVKGNFLCNERDFFGTVNNHEHYLTCKKCMKFYDEVLSGAIEKRYNNYK